MSVWSRVISPPMSLRVIVMLSVPRSFVMASRSDRVMLEVVDGRVVRLTSCCRWLCTVKTVRSMSLVARGVPFCSCERGRSCLCRQICWQRTFGVWLALVAVAWAVGDVVCFQRMAYASAAVSICNLLSLMYIATTEQPASYLFITGTSHLNHTRPKNAPHATHKFRVLLLNARTRPSFDQTDDGVDAETSLSLSLSLHFYLSSPPLHFFLTGTFGQYILLKK